MSRYIPVAEVLLAIAVLIGLCVAYVPDTQPMRAVSEVRSYLP
jgi:hypothetical protein